jgi:hypothetical protein
MKQVFIVSLISAILIFGCMATSACEGDAAQSCNSNGTCISGFVDASYGGNLDESLDSFGFDQAEVDIARCFGKHGYMQVDLEWVNDGGEWTAGAEQGFLVYKTGCKHDLAFTMGKFNAPIGFELLDAPDMYQYSHALVFDHGLPTNLTGAMVTLSPAEGVDVAAYFVNGWDNDVRHVKGPKTFGGRLAYTMGDLFTIGFSGITGRQTDTWMEENPIVHTFTDSSGTDMEIIVPGEIEISATSDRTVIDIDVTYTPMADLLIGGEFNMGTVTVVGTETESEWKGIMGMGHYDFTPLLGLTVRYDWFDDPDNHAFDGTVAESRTAITIAPTFALGDGMGALIEFRLDSSSEEVFTDSDGVAKSSTSSVALEMTYSF